MTVVSETVTQPPTRRQILREFLEKSDIVRTAQGMGLLDQEEVQAMIDRYREESEEKELQAMIDRQRLSTEQMVEA